MPPRYKIFLVEDEVVTREGIRDRVDWAAAGFTFAGEAPDGELALPLIHAARPDLLITDIKMPFMDGLELVKVVRETLPGIKTIILSGHDEFEYARQALRLGVSEYLLKPIAPQDFQRVLERVARQLDAEWAERERLQALQTQAGETLAARREQFLLRLVLGGVPALEALEQSLQLRLELIARWYRVLIIRMDYQTGCDFSAYQQVEAALSRVIGRHADSIAFKKGLEETVLIVKGDSRAHLEQDSDLLAEELREASAALPSCQARIRASAPVERLGEIPRAFLDLTQAPWPAEAPAPAPFGGEPSASAPRGERIPRMDPAAVERFLKTGRKADFDRFFDDFARAAGASLVAAPLFLEYIFLEVLVCAANFVGELGGQPAAILPALANAERLAARLRSLEDVRAQVREVLLAALDFRDHLAGNPYALLISRAREYIDAHFDDPEMSLGAAAAEVALSPGHFSMVFSRQTGETFIGYLSRRRIGRARELLLSTRLKASEIAARVGYDNPHYFSTVFKKITGQSPSEFRAGKGPG